MPAAMRCDTGPAVPDLVGDNVAIAPRASEAARTGQAAARAAADAVAATLRTLSANLMRIAAGGGTSSEIICQLLAVGLAMKRYNDLLAANPDDAAIAARLCVLRDGDAGAVPDDPAIAHRRAEDDILRAALGIAAARLSDQPVLERVGRDELHQAIRLSLSLQPR